MAELRGADSRSLAFLPSALASEVSGMQRGPRGVWGTVHIYGEGMDVLVAVQRDVQRQEERKEMGVPGSVPHVWRGQVESV